MNDPAIRLKHALDAIDRVERYTKRGRKVRFLANPMVQDAVIRNLEIVGEALGRIPASYRNAHPDIPWRKVTALRNVLVHEYFGVDVKIVWEVVEKRLPGLGRALSGLLKTPS